MKIHFPLKWQKLIKWFILNIWECFQNYIGKCEVRKYHLTSSHFFKDCYVYYITHDDSHSLGKHIFINKDTDDVVIFRHEYGHRIQSKLLGLLYIPLIGIPSYFHFLYWVKFRNDNWDEYYNFYCENWANKLSEKKIYHPSVK